MVDLTPAPTDLGLASPALGPWFREDGGATPPTLGAPGAQLSVGVSLATDMEWRAPAGCIASYFIATDPRPPGIVQLRQENGSPAFSTGELVVLVTLLPEVELRLEALSAVIPSPDGAAVAGIPFRPRVRYLAVAVPAVSAGTVSALERLREEDFLPTLSTDDEKAEFLGLKLDGSALTNGEHPATELRRPAQSNAVVLKNRTGSALGVSLWAFDYRGRPLDPGAVATWWSHLAAPGVFDNLWAHDDAPNQRTAAAAAGNFVHFATAHEGPISSELLARVTRTGLTQTTGSTALFTVATTASLGLGAAPATDDAPVPRIAMLPHRNYANPGTNGPGMFGGWNGGAWPATLPRDFVRIAVVDVESHLVGLTRSSSAQAQARTRIPALRNTAAAPFAATIDPATQLGLNVLNGGASAQLMAPVMDEHWGALVTGSFGADALPGTLSFAVKALRGEGTDAGATVGEQKVVVRFPAGSLPAGGWIRLWPHGLDTKTGLRFRQDGGGALADVAGEAFVVMAIPDGTAAPTDPADPPVRLSFDALVVTDNDARLYVEERYDRPATIAGDPIELPASPGVPPGTTLWICEQGAAMARGAGGLGGGQTLLGLPDDRDSGVYALIDAATLDDADLSANTLRNAAGGTDTLIVTAPAFADTPDGDVTDPTGPNGSTVLKRNRSGILDSLDVFGRPVPTMERREVAGVDLGTTAGFVGAAPGRSRNHEAAPAQLGHPGMPAAPEIHGTGLGLAGPVIGPLSLLMTERAAGSLTDFVLAAQSPQTAIPDPGGTTTFAALLETLTFGVTGDAAVRAFVAAFPTFEPGQSWLTLKGNLESATGIDLDPVIDTAIFDDEALAGAVDRVVIKTRDGAFQGATAMLAAIARAEDFIYIETPAIDPLTAGSSAAIDLVGAIKTRWTERPALRVMLCVPEQFLPGQPGKLEQIRKAGISSALKELQDAARDQVELFTPTAGSGRRLHMAATTVIVDDIVAITGTTHLWRRGLSFDSSLAMALFDENVVDGRAGAVRAARRQLFVDRLGLAANLVPDDPADMLAAVRRLNAGGGLQRVKPNAYPAATDTTITTDRDIWNPDGRPGGVSDWFLFFAGLSGGAATDVNNAIR